MFRLAPLFHVPHASWRWNTWNEDVKHFLSSSFAAWRLFFPIFLAVLYSVRFSPSPINACFCYILMLPKCWDLTNLRMKLFGRWAAEGQEKRREQSWKWIIYSWCIFRWICKIVIAKRRHFFRKSLNNYSTYIQTMGAALRFNEIP